MSAMKRRNQCRIKNIALIVTFLTAIMGCDMKPRGQAEISIEVLKDKIAGGWAGKMIGVAYGGPTEFQYNGVINEDEITWDPESIRNSIYEDDLYVQMSFMMTMDEYGIDAPLEKFAESYAEAGYMLFHANRKGRKNFWDGIMPPLSGHPDYNLHADDIDFQIEADFIGFMNPGMPQSSNRICDRIGHIMNYGDGVYGGMFVAALYTAAYFENDVESIVNEALKAIPARSKYAMCIQDVIDGYRRNPEDWRATWYELQSKWGHDDVCGALDEFNIDAKINGAYIVMGLLYGGGDFERTMEISTRCGQDSDCNPSNASGVLGIILGYDKIPDKWKGNIKDIADMNFIHTSYSFNSVVERTLEYAQELIVSNGGSISNGICQIKMQRPIAPKLEQSFSNVSAGYRTTVQDPGGWDWEGQWTDIIHEQWGTSEMQKVSQQKGSSMTLTFEGTGAVIMGRWDRDGGKADVYVDGEFAREIDNYYWMDETGAGFHWLNGAHLFHVLNLSPGEHSIRVVINGKKNEKSLGTKLRVARAIIYQ
jgi:hypothetical protein